MTDRERPLRADARRNRDAVIDAAGELFAQRGDAVQMDEIAERARLGVGTLYRHFADKQALIAAIIGRRFEEMTALARRAEQIADPWTAFETLLYGYLESALSDAAFRFALLGPDKPNWQAIETEKEEFSTVTERIVQRAVDGGHLRRDFTPDDFVLITRGAMATMNGPGNWRRYVELVLNGIRH